MFTSVCVYACVCGGQRITSGDQIFVFHTFFYSWPGHISIICYLITKPISIPAPFLTILAQLSVFYPMFKRFFPTLYQSFLTPFPAFPLLCVWCTCVGTHEGVCLHVYVWRSSGDVENHLQLLFHVIHWAGFLDQTLSSEIWLVSTANLLWRFPACLLKLELQVGLHAQLAFMWVLGI